MSTAPSNTSTAVTTSAPAMSTAPLNTTMAIAAPTRPIFGSYDRDRRSKEKYRDGLVRPKQTAVIATLIPSEIIHNIVSKLGPATQRLLGCTCIDLYQFYNSRDYYHRYLHHGNLPAVAGPKFYDAIVVSLEWDIWVEESSEEYEKILMGWFGVEGKSPGFLRKKLGMIAQKAAMEKVKAEERGESSEKVYVELGKVFVEA